MKRDSNNCVLFFVKYPTVGRVKTRLAEQLGAEVVSDLYKSFVADTLAKLHRLNFNLKIVYDPPGAKKDFQQWLGEEYSYMPQIGEDLGQRMKNAFLEEFKRDFNKTIVIGSDCPDLPVEYLDLAFTALETNDVVVGPSSDGGYYLIGFTKDSFLPEVFEGIRWSSNRVFKQTADILKFNKRKLYLLPQWHDVDTVADLNKLIERNRYTDFHGSRTLSLIRQIEVNNEKGMI